MIKNIPGVILDGTSPVTATQEEQPIEFAEAEYCEIYVPVVGENGVALANPDDYTGVLTVKRRAKDPPERALFARPSDSNTLNVYKFILQPADTFNKSYPYTYTVELIHTPTGHPFQVVISSPFVVADSTYDFGGDVTPAGPNMAIIGLPTPLVANKFIKVNSAGTGIEYGDGGGGGASTLADLYAAGGSPADNTFAIDATRGPVRFTSTHGSLSVGALNPGSTINGEYLTYTPAEVGASRWAEYIQEDDQNIPGRQNQVHIQGWNLAPEGRFNTNESAMGFSFESYYHPTELSEVMEHHVVCIGRNGFVHRPLSLFMTIPNGTTTYSINAGTLFFEEPGQANRYWAFALGAGGGCEVTTTSTPFTFKTNNVPFVQAARPNTSLATLLMIDAADHFLLGQAGLQMRVAGDCVVEGLFFPLAQDFSQNCGHPNFPFGTFYGQALDLANGSSLPVSAPNRGAIRYNNATKKVEVSVDGGAWTVIGP